MYRPRSPTKMSKRIHSFRRYFWFGTGQRGNSQASKQASKQEWDLFRWEMKYAAIMNKNTCQWYRPWLSHTSRVTHKSKLSSSFTTEVWDALLWSRSINYLQSRPTPCNTYTTPFFFPRQVKRKCIAWQD